MNIFDAPNVPSENFINLYVAKVLRKDPLTKTIEVTLILDNQLFEVSDGTQFFLFLTNTRLEDDIYN